MIRSCLIVMLVIVSAISAAKNIQKVALITGISGQDGVYLCKLLLSKGYIVHGITTKRTLTVDTYFELNASILDFQHKSYIQIHNCSLTDITCISIVTASALPDEVYNLAAVALPYVEPSMHFELLNANILGVLSVLEAIRLSGLSKTVRFVQTGSSAQFGPEAESPQSETTEMNPSSLYGLSKKLSHMSTVFYRTRVGMHASNAILYSHESRLRSEAFVTRKVTRAVAEIEAGKRDALSVGNLNGMRDWSHAEDVVEALWMIANSDKPDDYIVANSALHSVRELIEFAFITINMPITWRNKRDSIEEVGVDASGKIRVTIDPSFFRPMEPATMTGSTHKLANALGWTPKHSFEDIVAEMLDEDRQILSTGMAKALLQRNK